MNWKFKALLQRSCARLPLGRELVYYGLQRSVGTLRKTPDPFWYLAICRDLVASVQAAGVSVQGARVMEVGTGWGVQTPICFFLCGVDSVVTFDQHCYLKGPIVMDSIKILTGDKERAVSLVGSIAGRENLLERLQLLADCETYHDVLQAARITYRAPADASSTGLPDHSIDLQISNNVLEHIPHTALTQILQEANRVLTPSGVTVHRLGPSDHFSEDPSILPINFLRYTQEEWDRLADNQFAYHNRLRASDYKEIYTAAGHQIVDWKPTVHPESVNALKAGFPIAPQFQGKSPEDLSTVLLQIVSRPKNGLAAVSDVSM